MKYSLLVVLVLFVAVVDVTLGGRVEEEVWGRRGRPQTVWVDDGLFAWEDRDVSSLRGLSHEVLVVEKEVQELWRGEKEVRSGNSLWYVCLNGSNSNPGTETSPFQTIQKALDVSIDGDLIQVEAGTYPPEGNSDLSIIKSVYIRGDPSGQTVIDLNYDAHRFAFVEEAGLFRLDSMTFLGASGDDDDNAIISMERSGFLVSSCVFKNSNSIYSLRLHRSVGSIYDSEISGNSGPVLVNHTLASFISTTFKNNYGKLGGAVRVLNSIEAVFVRDCTFSDNSASDHGGAIYVADESSWSQNTYVFVAENMVCENNKASKGGGCLYSSSPIRVSDSYFLGNSVERDGEGGGVFLTVSGDDLMPPADVFLDCVFTNNTAGSNGGGIFADFLQEYSTLKNVDFRKKDAESMVVSHCAFDSNSAHEGGGIFLSNANLTFHVNNTLFENNNAVEYGGGIFVSGAFSLVETSNFTNNNANEAGAAVVLYDGEISNCSFTKNAAEKGACCIANNALIRLSSFHQNPSGGVVVLQGAIVNIDDCQLSVEASDLATLPDLDIFTSARVFMSGVSSVSYLSVKGTLILVGPTVTSQHKKQKLLVGTLQLGELANIQLNTNLTVLQNTSFSSNVVFINQTSTHDIFSPDCWFVNKGLFHLTPKGGSSNAVAVYWNNISFVNYGNLTLENNTNMVFDPQSQFENQNIFMGHTSASITTTAVQNYGTLYLRNGNSSDTHHPFIINGDLSCKPGSKIQFNTDFAQQLLQVNGEANLTGTAFFDTTQRWEGPVMTYGSRQGSFKKHLASRHHATLIYYTQFLQASIGRGAGLTGGWVVGGAVFFVVLCGVGVVFYKYFQYRKNKLILLRQQTEQEDMLTCDRD